MQKLATTTMLLLVSFITIIAQSPQRGKITGKVADEQRKCPPAHDAGDNYSQNDLYV